MSTHGLYLRPALFFLLLVCSPSKRITAQHKPAPEWPQFEVASVKPADPNAPHMVGVKVYPGGRVAISGLSLKALIATAFRLSYWQISGRDAWTENGAYDVEAKPAENLRSSIKDLRHTLFGIEDKHLREMLQALLIDRFQLKFHRETKRGDVFLLQRNGKPLGLRPTEIPPGSEVAADRSSFGSIGYAGGIWVISDATMPQLAKFASDYVLYSSVLDRTELSGSFDYKQRLPDSEPNYSDNSDSFLRLIPELGLKLERSKGQVEMFVIDHAVKPSPN
jgi:uncharacterized protein (TIGR03435 family)